MQNEVQLEKNAIGLREVVFQNTFLLLDQLQLIQLLDYVLGLDTSSVGHMPLLKF
jgi:hypothetical protein